MKRSILAMTIALVTHTATAGSAFDQTYKIELKEVSASGSRTIESLEVGANDGRPVHLSSGSATNFTETCDAAGNPSSWNTAKSGLNVTIEPMTTTGPQPNDLKLVSVKFKYSRLISLETKKFGCCTVGLPRVEGFTVDASLSLAKATPTLVNRTGAYEIWMSVN